MEGDKDEIGGDEKGEETTPEVKPETTPKAEKEDTITLSSKELNNRINAAKSELGRTLKSTVEAHSVLKRNFDSQGEQLSALEETLKSFKVKERENELRAANGQPEILDSVRLKHQAEDRIEEANKRLSEVEKRETQHQTELEESRRMKAEKLANELAEESGLPVETLLLVATDKTENGRLSFNLERMKSIAKSVPKGEKGEEEGDEEGAEKVKGQKTRVSGTKSGSKGLANLTDYYAAYNRGDINAGEMAKARERFGVSY